MLDSRLIRENFKTLQEFEHFNLAWTRACAKLNPTKKNMQRLEDVEYRAELLRLEA
jgi:hypothetical protein